MTPERRLYEQRRDELADIFAQARHKNGSYDFRQVPMFRHLHSRNALVKLVQAMNEELNTLYDEMVIAEQDLARSDRRTRRGGGICHGRRRAVKS